MSKIDWRQIHTTDDKQYLESLLKNEAPALVRASAMRLYELGEIELALGALVSQLELYKQDGVPRTTKYEVCTNAALDLGRMGDARVLDKLIEAFEVFGDLAAFAVSLVNMSEVVERMLRLSKSVGIRGFAAKLALGFMGEESVLPELILIYKNVEAYSREYEGRILWSLRRDIMYMVGVMDNGVAETFFLQEVEDRDILAFLIDYVVREKHGGTQRPRNLCDLGWKIVKKYGWDQYLNSEAERRVFDLDRSAKLSNANKEIRHKTLSAIHAEIEKRKRKME